MATRHGHAGFGTSASCVIDGHRADIYSDADASAARAPVTVRAGTVMAAGKTWYASVESNSKRVQRHVAARIGVALGGTVAALPK